tara:strand:- start:1277 stop:1666 length:390 start_codon:yes stop_codon:yes gene_type:complete
MNVIILHGRLGRDPELRQSKSGTDIVTFSLATNDGWGDNKRTNWHRCKAFGKRAETIERYLKRGDGVMIRGSIDYREWVDDEGAKHKLTEVLVDDFDFVAKSGDRDAPVERRPVERQPAKVDSFDDVPF